MSPVTADRWNLLIPVGYPVLCWPGEKIGPGEKTTTRTPAWTLNSDVPVVSVERRAGGIGLTHVVPLVLVSNMYVECGYPTSYPGWGPICASDCCRASASWAVTDRDGGYFWRCDDHKALLKNGEPGWPALRAPRRFDRLPHDDRSAARMLGTETYFDAMRKALDSAKASSDGFTVSWPVVGYTADEERRPVVFDPKTAKLPDLPYGKTYPPGGLAGHTPPRGDDTPEVRMILDAARDCGFTHRDYSGLLRAVDLLRHGPNVGAS